ncbi:MAG: hypothetical protein UY40_C0005G0010 [candidate division CPR1 bacterium GW2011_GWC1_49_13]|uniref:Baseplate protein J-like barrel domain-containing protein n=1 Tax=candidate division CPR1 bacterium GW2011_GWC1_49_13 TaxID=1618342 RepID=A0A0G1XTN8_9BACT|nr:MAG: hypothetical protein UY40_C0005G0010 [candidate division CPR1 bacterium GW2011_GWC1_49_13]
MSLYEMMEKILGAEDGAKVEIPEENFNLLMLKILKAKARKENRQLNLVTAGNKGRTLVRQIGEKEEDLPQGEKAALPIKVKKKFTLPKLGKIGRFALFALAGLITLGGIAYWFLYYFPRAEINLSLRPIPLIKEIAVVADTEAEEVDGDKGVIPGKTRSVEESGEKSTAATGTATVGEKATGTITFTSTVNQSCGQGTKVKENDSGLIFLTDAALTFSSAPEDKDVAVTAEKIGPTYNLASGKTFTVVSGCSIGGLSIVGVNSAAFTGGTSQQVKIVSSTDRSKLLTELKKELTDKAKEELTATGDEVIIASALKVEVTKQDYSHAVGEQADSVSLSLTVKVTTISYLGADIQNLISQVIGELVPEGFTLFAGETEIEPLDPTLTAARLRFTAKITAQVVPEVDVEKIKAELATRSIPSAEEYLSGVGEITGYEISLFPNLPASLQRIPRNVNRIKINLVTELPEGGEEETNETTP